MMLLCSITFVTALLSFLVSEGNCLESINPFDDICTSSALQPYDLPLDASILQRTPYHIYSQADVDILKFNNCTNLGVSAIISPNDTSIVLAGIQTLWGNLTIQNSSTLSNFTAPQLSRVAGNVVFSNLSNVSTIDLPNLQELEILSLFSLPSLKSISMPPAINATTLNTGKPAMAGVNISNTALEEITAANTISITNNAKLRNVTVIGQSFYTPITLSNNGNGSLYCDLSGGNEFSSIWVENCAFLNMSGSSIQSYGDSDGDLTLQNNTFSSVDFSGLKSLNSLSIINNTNYVDINFPYVHSISRFSVTYYGTSQLSYTFKGLSVLYSMTLVGYITSVFPAENYLVSFVNVTSTYPDLDCSNLDELTVRNYGVLSYKDYTCRASAPGTTQDTAKHRRCWPHKTCLSPGDKAGIGIGVVAGVILIILTILRCIVMRQERKSLDNYRPTILTRFNPWSKKRIAAAPEIGMPKYNNDDENLEMHPPGYQGAATETAVMPPHYEGGGAEEDVNMDADMSRSNALPPSQGAMGDNHEEAEDHEVVRGV